MPYIHLFNPENDLALAHGGRYYTAPPNAIALHNAGEVLPLWYGDDGDVAIIEKSDRQWIERIRDLMGIGVDVYSPTKHNNGFFARPWGWSLDACKQLQHAGVSEDLIPSEDEIDTIRRLSHRRMTIVVLTELMSKLDFEISRLPVEAQCANDVFDFICHNGDCFIKSPWSSSGRGVVNSASLTEIDLRRRVEGIIRKQGSVLCEKALDKVLDFAMLFYSDGEKIKRVGYSSFFTATGSAYAGNIMVTDEYIEQKLSAFVPNEKLIAISDALENILADKFVCSYTGYFGVDMLIYRDADKEYKIAPCIEVNLRMTMGVVAKLLYNRYVSPESQAVFRVEYGRCTASKLRPVIENNRLVAGTLSIIPPNENFYITIEASSKPFKFGI